MSISAQSAKTYCLGATKQRGKRRKSSYCSQHCRIIKSNPLGKESQVGTFQEQHTEAEEGEVEDRAHAWPIEVLETLAPDALLPPDIYHQRTEH